MHPILFKYSKPVTSDLVTKWRSRIVATCNELTAGKFNSTNVHAVNEMLQVCFIISKQAGIKSFTNATCAAALAFTAMLERYKRTKRYGMTGDELQAFHTNCDDLIVAIGDLPAATLLNAIEENENGKLH